MAGKIDEDIKAFVMRRQYSQPTTRGNTGGVICALGLPLSVVGVIITAVGYTEVEGKDHIWYFEILGPGLLGLAFLAFVCGFFLRGVIDIRYLCCFPCFRPKQRSEILNLDELEEFTSAQRVELIDRSCPVLSHNGIGQPVN